MSTPLLQTHITENTFNVWSTYSMRNLNDLNIYKLGNYERNGTTPICCVFQMSLGFFILPCVFQHVNWLIKSILRWSEGRKEWSHRLWHGRKYTAVQVSHRCLSWILKEEGLRLRTGCIVNKYLTPLGPAEPIRDWGWLLTLQLEHFNNYNYHIYS